jgi:hypothetical protein
MPIYSQELYKMTNSSATFTFDKRNFLHQKLDEILHSWARKSGHGTFFLSVTDGVPNFQFGLQLDLSDAGSASEPLHQSVHQQHQHQRRGLAKQARNRARAAKYQAAKAASTAAASAVSTNVFPGQGQIVGAAPKPVISLPLKIGDVFPPSSTNSSTPAPSSNSVVSSPPNSTSKVQLTNFAGPVKCRDAVLSDDSDDETEEEQFYTCGQSSQDIENNSPSYYCPLCMKCFHVQCITGHKCISFM